MTIKFKKGDRVFIAKSSDWCGFNSVMQTYVGRLGTVLGDCDTTPPVLADGKDVKHSFYFPNECLVLVDEAQPEPPKFTINEPIQDYERF